MVSIFSMVHAYGLRPRTSVVRHYASVPDPLTGRPSSRLVGVYRMSWAEYGRILWGGPIDVNWDSFLVYRTARWPE